MRFPPPRGASRCRFRLPSGLLDGEGRSLPLQLTGEVAAAEGETRVLLMEEERQSFTFSGLAERPIPSVLRNFSAPVRLRMQRSREELAFLMAHDSDPFNRWDAGQRLVTNLLFGVV